MYQPVLKISPPSRMVILCHFIHRSEALLTPQLSSACLSGTLLHLNTRAPGSRPLAYFKSLKIK